MTGAAAEDVLFSAESSAMEGLLIVSEMGALVNVKVISTDAFVEESWKSFDAFPVGSASSLTLISSWRSIVPLRSFPVVVPYDSQPCQQRRSRPRSAAPCDVLSGSS